MLITQLGFTILTIIVNIILYLKKDQLVDYLGLPQCEHSNGEWPLRVDWRDRHQLDDLTDFRSRKMMGFWEVILFPDMGGLLMALFYPMSS